MEGHTKLNLDVDITIIIISDAPIWNLADIPITDNGAKVSADTDHMTVSDQEVTWKWLWKDENSGFGYF